MNNDFALVGNYGFRAALMRDGFTLDEVLAFYASALAVVGAFMQDDINTSLEYAKHRYVYWEDDPRLRYMHNDTYGIYSLTTEHVLSVPSFILWCEANGKRKAT